MKECNIIKDLLPNYIEELTSNDTNNFIKEHIQECDSCKDTLKIMEQGLKCNEKLNKEILETNDVKFLKKLNKKMLKKAVILGTLIGCIILIFIYMCICIYRFCVINNLSNKYNNFKQLENIYLETNNNCLTNNFQFVENLKEQYWFKDDIIKIKQTSTKYNEYNNYIRYIDLKQNLIYVFNEKEKTVKIIEQVDNKEINEIFLMLKSKYKSNFGDKLKLALNIYIPIYKKDNYYIINDLENNMYDLKTGLISINSYSIYTGSNDNINNKYYQTYTYYINSVDDKDVIFPNLEEYQIIK